MDNKNILIDQVAKDHVIRDLNLRSSRSLPREASLEPVQFVYDLSGTSYNTPSGATTSLQIGGAGTGQITLISNPSGSGVLANHAFVFLSYTVAGCAAEAGTIIGIALELTIPGYSRVVDIRRIEPIIAATNQYYQIEVSRVIVQPNYYLQARLQRWLGAGVFPAGTYLSGGYAGFQLAPGPVY